MTTRKQEIVKSSPIPWRHAELNAANTGIKLGSNRCATSQSATKHESGAKVGGIGEISRASR